MINKKLTKKNTSSRPTHNHTTHHTKNTKHHQNNLYIGCHASIADGVLEAIKYVESINGNALQIFMGSKLQSSLKYKHKFKDQNEIDEIKKYITTNKICLVIHSIYTINLCKCPSNSGRIKYAHDNILYDLKYGQMIGAKCVILHMGSSTILNRETAIANYIDNINYIVSKMPKGIILSLETSAGSGSQIGWDLEELAQIWNKIKHNNKNLSSKSCVGICIDTAHIFVSGYDITTVKGISDYLKRFDSLIGIKNITNFHINDSKYKLGSKVDEHKGIGQGLLYNDVNNTNTNTNTNTNNNSKKALKYIKTFCIKRKIPMILETHSAGSATSEGSHKGQHGYEYEIDLIHKL